MVFRDSKDLDLDPTTHSASVLVQGIDEYTTKSDWNRIWKQHIEPVQNELWEKRGQRPRGQQARSLERLRNGLLLYEKFLVLGSMVQVQSSSERIYLNRTWRMKQPLR